MCKCLTLLLPKKWFSPRLDVSKNIWKNKKDVSMTTYKGGGGNGVNCPLVQAEGFVWTTNTWIFMQRIARARIILLNISNCWYKCEHSLVKNNKWNKTEKVNHPFLGYTKNWNVSKTSSSDPVWWSSSVRTQQHFEKFKFSHFQLVFDPSLESERPEVAWDLMWPTTGLKPVAETKASSSLEPEGAPVQHGGWRFVCSTLRRKQPLDPRSVRQRADSCDSDKAVFNIAPHGKMSCDKTKQTKICNIIKIGVKKVGIRGSGG